MKILAVSDEENPAFWENHVPGRLKEYDLMLSCGDLKAEYLSFMVTMGRGPLLYVHGNHDESYPERPPEGCDCVDDHFVIVNGLRILGLGGCMRYREGRFQYTEAQMRRRIARLTPHLRRNKGVDIVITHAPPRGLGDLDDPVHRGFECLRTLIDRWHPAYLIHGHVHLRYEHRMPREQEYGGTRIINASESFTLEIPDRPMKDPRDKGRLIWKTRRKEPDGWPTPTGLF
ncbi:MAG: metallophosphoesterase family protein [Lachnospiraceae bacterium]|nr:metallophosphoesterase family protein [Lachnospiraceae bacterium]